MDFKKLSEVNTSKIADSSSKTVAEKKKEIIDSIKKRREERKQSIADAEKRRKLLIQSKRSREERKQSIADAEKKFSKFKVADSYVNLKKKIKDSLDETETTDGAVEAALAEITPDAPAEQVLAAVVEVLAETIDMLSEPELEEDPEEDLAE